MINWFVKKVKISDLKDYNHNPRKISKGEMEKLVNALTQDGYHQRIVVNSDNTIIGGHQRKKALIKAGYSKDDFIDVLSPDRELSQQEVDRINIRDNLPYGEYDFDILGERFTADELGEFGMPEDWLKELKDDQLIEDSANDEFLEDGNPQEVKSKIGDLYILGNHRLLCGDSTVASDVERLLDGNVPVLMVTDPPYGVKYEPEWRDSNFVVGNRSKGKVLNDDRVDWSEAYSLFPGDVAYIWHSSLFTHKFAEHIEACGFNLVSLIIWAKQHFAISRGDYHNQHEPLWYAVRKDKKHNWQGRRDQSTTWDIANNNIFGNPNVEEKFGYGTQKPLECMLRPILNNSASGEGVYDPFCGSGTTLISCEKSDRVCYAMELFPAYVDMIVSRWEKETGQKAVLS